MNQETARSHFVRPWIRTAFHVGSVRRAAMNGRSLGRSVSSIFTTQLRTEHPAEDAHELVFEAALLVVEGVALNVGRSLSPNLISPVA